MKNNTLDNPNIVFIDGSHYKIGVHDFVFRHNGNEWVRSTKNKSEVNAYVLDKKKYTGGIFSLSDNTIL